MRYLILCTLFLVGCKLDSDHNKERENIMLKAEAFCKCRGGVLSVSIAKLSSFDDSGTVICHNGAYRTDIQELEYIDQSCENKGK